MEIESRTKKSLLNARVNLFFYFVFIFLSFFSRKTFLDCLGPEFLGLSGTLSNILGVLSLAEMGVGTAVGYYLYKPLQEHNKSKIEELVSVFGYLYNRIGLFIFGAAVLVSCFIPLIFKDTPFSYGLIYFAFFTILSSSLCSYFLNYRQIILSADQKGYVVTAYLQGAMFVKILIQMAIAYYWGNYYLWIGLEIIFSVTSCLILNWKIKKTYPWLNASVKKGKSAYAQNKHIITFTKQVFVHKIKDFLLNQSDQILIFAFVSLKMVAFYGNYTLIVSRLSQAFNSALNSFSAGVGNLVAEGNKERMLSVFWEIVSVRFFVGGFIVFTIYHLIEPFISLWIGAQYILDNSILILLLVDVFIMQTRGAVDMFNHAHGLYADTWSAWVEGIVNIGTTLSLAPFFGICGILLGKIASLMIIVVWWKPLYLFRSGFKLPISVYWKNILKYYATFILCFGVSSWLYNLIPIQASRSFLDWIIMAVVCIILFTIIYTLGLSLFTPGTNRLLVRAKAYINRR